MDLSTLTIAALLISIVFVIFTSFLGKDLLEQRNNYNAQSARLPAATRYENLAAMIESEQFRLEELRQTIREAEQKVQDRDRIAAQVTSLQEQLDSMRVEYASLESARREIEETKGEAAEVAANLALVEQDYKAKHLELEKISLAVEDKLFELKRLEDELGSKNIDELRQIISSLKADAANLESQLVELREERSAAIRVLEEARTFEARRAVMEQEANKLVAEVEAGREELRDLRQRISEAKEVAEDLRSARLEVDELGHQLMSMEARQSVLETSKDLLENAAERLQGEVVDLQDQLGSLKDQRGVLLDTKDELARLQGRIALAQEELSKTHGSSGDPSIEALTKDLTKFPAFLNSPSRLRGVLRPETEALAHVGTYLKGYGLQYPHRTVRAFHTALKINDNAQITVLAGVSGTGKSLLPRRYAEAMGIHFHQIAVEPRWDSPQDLLGFYNYIEKQYRATDLARLLVHMDPYTSIKSIPADAPDRKDHMALVLLDEMNLARVEYYFSEFLSRLEVRPRFHDAGDEARRKDALIPVDIRGVILSQTLSLFPSHNVLFAGTMNDDESTQALSDKVLDRANVMQFAAPKDFKIPEASNKGSIPDEAQSFKSWRSWVRPVSYLQGGDRDTADQVIGKLAVLMELCGRPFGHRLQESILAYVANYPVPPQERLNVVVPLADQVELRILPKLRGVDLASHRGSLDQLASLIRDELNDTEFAERLGETVDKQSSGSGLFVWRGLTRRNG